MTSRLDESNYWQLLPGYVYLWGANCTSRHFKAILIMLSHGMTVGTTGVLSYVEMANKRFNPLRKLDS